MGQPGVQGPPKRTMLLPDLDLPTTIDTSTGDMAARLYEPALAAAVGYDRGVGFFSSGWLRIVARGMAHFAANGGRARIITSPILDQADWKALQAGAEANLDPILHRALSQNIEELRQHLAENTLSALAWMVADEILTFKLALPQNKLAGGDFHDKFGIFTDAEGNQVSFSGSPNESIQGFHNYESNKIFKSWEPAFAPLVEHDMQRFERLWQNEDANVRVYSLPEAAREQIIRLRVEERPYTEPEWIKEGRIAENQGSYATTKPKHITLWDHQKEAISAWEDNGRIGLLSMATGSGKTLTAIAAAQQSPNLSLLIIAVPRNNLVDQWNEEIQKFTDFGDPILIYENSNLWQDRLFNKLRISDRNSWTEPVVAIGSMRSLSGRRFQSVLKDIGTPANAMLIVDEVHNIGAPTYRNILHPSFDYRLGLSATPERNFDPEGNKIIDDYFKKMIYVYGMNQALADGRLCPYYYHVYAVTLSPEEYEKYLWYTRKIIALRDGKQQEKLSWKTNDKIENDSKEIEQLLFARARILKKAGAKSHLIREIIGAHPPVRCLIYCADKEQLQDVHEILNADNITHAKYFSDTPSEQRKRALEAIGKGHVPILLAIDCLDEGVDVPAVDSAIILASSSNKRQFIQRRGRVLRQSKEKDFATLVDVIVVPPYEVGREGKWMLRGELARAKEMADLAENQTEALLQVKSYTEAFGIYLTELLAEEDNEFE
jgi:superfamily II DNA or RNA helicase